MGLTYGLRDPRDLLNKLKRDAALFVEEATSDRFFNFVVTGYSLIDWIKNCGSSPQRARWAVSVMRDDPYILVCRDLANASKHFTLTRRAPNILEATSNQGFGLGGFGKGGYGVGEEQIDVYLLDGTMISSLQFVEKVIVAWDEFFRVHGMSQLPVAADPEADLNR